MEDFFYLLPSFLSLLIPNFWCLLIFGAVIAFAIISQQNREKQKSAWQRLAAAHHLTFVPNNSYFSNGAYVSGSFRGHPLLLESFERKQGKSSVTCTRIRVLAESEYSTPPNESQSELSLPFQVALDRFISPSLHYTMNKINVEPGGQSIYYEQQGIIQDTKFLEYLFELLASLAEAYPVVAAYGGEAVPALHPMLNHQTMGEINLQLLRDIAEKTSRQLAHRAQRLVCPACLTRFGPHTIDLPWAIDPTYYGCRTCGQSRKFLEGSVVAVLDNQTTVSPVQQDDLIPINWSATRKLFDFDAVEIVRASDEDVERFAVQVGNDTDPTRQPRYERLHCVIHPNCGLSDNTLRILRRTFGQVDVHINQGQTTK